MKRSTILTLGGVAAAVAIAVVAVPAIAGGGPFGNCGPHGFGPMGGNWGSGMMQFAQGGWGGRGGFANNPLIKLFDTNGDGVVSPEEAKAGTAALLKKHDTDGNGTLSKKEFGDLVADMARGFAERPFTMLDGDNDGQVSLAEINAPAQMMARMHAWRHGPATPEAAPQKP